MRGRCMRNGRASPCPRRPRRSPDHVRDSSSEDPQSDQLRVDRVHAAAHPQLDPIDVPGEVDRSRGEGARPARVRGGIDAADGAQRRDRSGAAVHLEEGGAQAARRRAVEVGHLQGIPGRRVRETTTESIGHVVARLNAPRGARREADRGKIGRVDPQGRLVDGPGGSGGGPSLLGGDGDGDEEKREDGETHDGFVHCLSLSLR